MPDTPDAPTRSPAAPGASPAALITRTLSYLSGLARPEDASLARFAAAIGDSVEQGEGDYAEATWSDDGTGWIVTVSATENASPVVRYEAAHDRLNNDTVDVDLTPVCQVDLEHAIATLVAMGFEPGPSLPAAHGYARYGATTYVFTRGPLAVEVLAQRRQGGSAMSGPMCIRRLEARFVGALSEAR